MVLLQPIHLVSAHPNLRSPAQGEATPPPARPCGTDPPHGRHIKIRQVQKCRHGRQAPCHDIHGYDFDDVLIDTGYGVENTLDQQQHQIAPLNHHGRSEAASAGAPVQATSEDWLRNMPVAHDSDYKSLQDTPGQMRRDEARVFTLHKIRPQVRGIQTCC
ncbi:uncharacterized protein EI97DRAFT_136611 [Westerdykella ornata]|uniref:Uncharacterized protein n=1 Tax=Westerdykella ornata TaxID=318751 RepID=A0A6A6JD70_WESOR|nr:uncharacterized protein EI97DRAFT_136611 [Westerdykella ornata]KAF2274123.1 hypothetical protein EI97DRAFT_136611 [Westerdykella ornata]